MGPEIDRLSDLPDGLLHDVLARLTLDDAVRTAVLARRWRHLWCTNPVLDFAGSCELTKALPDETAYVAAVDHCLRQCAPIEKLRSLYFYLDDWPDWFDVPGIFERWLSFAAARTVESLRVIGTSDEKRGCIADAPASLFRCHSLRSLDLTFCRLPSPSKGDGGGGKGLGFSFPLLLDLCLESVNGEIEALDLLLAACPQLVSLALWGCDIYGNLLLSSSTLTSLDVADYYYTSDFDRLEIRSAPRLDKLYLRCNLSTVKFVNGAVPKLDTATVFSRLSRSFAECSEWRRFLLKFTHVKVFSVNNWFVQFMLSESSLPQGQCPVFGNVKELHYCEGTFKPNDLHVLIDNLRYFPSLEKLYLHCNYTPARTDVFYTTKGNAAEDFGASEKVLKDVNYEFARLEKVIVTGFSCEIEVKKFIEFLMDKSTILESIVICYKKGMDKKKLDVVSEDIHSCHRASRNLQLSFLEDPLFNCPVHD